MANFRKSNRSPAPSSLSHRHPQNPRAERNNTTLTITSAHRAFIVPYDRHSALGDRAAAVVASQNDNGFTMNRDRGERLAGDLGRKINIWGSRVMETRFALRIAKMCPIASLVHLHRCSFHPSHDLPCCYCRRPFAGRLSRRTNGSIARPDNFPSRVPGFLSPIKLLQQTLRFHAPSVPFPTPKACSTTATLL